MAGPMVGRLAGLVLRISAWLARCERVALMVLLGWLLALVLLNVATRYARVPIYWIDEAAVYSVVWLCFIGASVMTRLRMDFAVTMLTDKLGPAWARRAKVVAGAAVVAFGLALAAMCWVWMDPVGIARFGFDAREYAAESFNFLYTERTQTLNWPVWIIQLIMPLFALTFTVHALANLLEDLDLHPRQVLPGFPKTTADEVN